MPTSTPLDTVILSQPPPAAIHPSHLCARVSPGGQTPLPAPHTPGLRRRPLAVTLERVTPSRARQHYLGLYVCVLLVYMCELNLLRATSLQIHASERTPTNVLSARHTGACVCVCALRHMFVCVCVHMYVFACVLAFPSPPWPTLHWGCSTSLFFRALLIKFWFSFVQTCVCVRVSWCGFGFLGLGMQSQATSQRFSVLVLTRYSQ